MCPGISSGIVEKETGMAMTEKTRDAKVAVVDEKIKLLQEERKWLMDAPLSGYGSSTSSASSDED